jgi:signal transduction histidine kinase/CheY-like chemotaxis protein
MTLRARLVGLCGLLGAALSLALLVYLPAEMDAQSRRWVESRSLGIAHLLSTATEAALDFDDPVSAAASLASLDATRGAAYALLLRPDGSVLASWRAPDPSALPEIRGGDPVAFRGGLIHVRIPVMTRTGRTGSLRLGFDLHELEERRLEARKTVFGMSVVLVVIGLAGTFGIGTLLVRPLRRMTDVAQRITAGDDRAARDLPLDRGDEAGAMATAFASMLRRLYEQQLRINSLNDDLEQRVAERTEALEHANREIALRLSELKRTQEQLVVADRRISLGRLAAGVAHEINNPLAFILGNLEFLSREVAELRAYGGRGERPERGLREVAAAVDQAAQGAERVRQIVRGLKAFSRNDDDARAPTSLASALESAIGMAGHEVKHRARLVRSIGAAPRVDASEVRLTQVFLNLIVNAAHAIPEGASERHEIRVSLRTDERGWAVAEVADTGAGMPPEVLARLFEPFFTTKPMGEGTGLGLSISHGIVTGLGGSITVRSEVGAGSTFSVALPPSAWQEAAKVSAPPEPARVPRARLLVVDDEPLVATAVKRALARHHDVEIAGSAADALERIRRGERFDRILCDLMMPGMGGAEFHAELSRLDGQLADRVTFMTGGAFTESAREFLERSRQPWLEKPLDLQQLRRIVDGARA